MRAELAEIRDFLAATPPFSLLDAELLDALPAQLAIRYLRRGGVFPPPEEDGRADARAGPLYIFGLVSRLTSGSHSTLPSW